MTRRHGAILLALTTVCAAAGLVGWYLLVVRLPDPSTASRAGLFRWLVLRDLSAEPREVQVSLVNRLQVELTSEQGSDMPPIPLGAHYRARLEKNAEHLKYVWFTTRAEEYELLEPDEQMAFLDAQIGAVSRWSSLLPPAGASAASEAKPGESAVGFFDQLEGWIAAASGAEKERMLRAVVDGTVCWLATRDLAEQPGEVRLALALRIVRELNAGMRLDEILLDLNPQEREKLFANGELLLEVWLHAEAREFANLPDAERGAYLDRRIDEVYRWGVLEALGGSDAQGSNQMAGVARFAALTNEWIERSPAADRANLVRLVAAIQRQILWRQFRPR